MTVTEGLTRGALVAELAEVVGAPHEARFIVDEVLGLGLVLGHPGPPTGPLSEAAVAAARAMAARRAAGEPLQYVFGHWPFRTLDLLVDPRVLIPRPESEQVAGVALAEARRLATTTPGKGARGLVAVDAGTGSGAIALALAAELGRPALREVWATDASADALAVAAANLRTLRAGRGRPAPGRVGRGELAQCAPRDAARGRRPRGLEPALRGRGRVGRAGGRGPARSPGARWWPGRAATAPRAWRTWRRCSRSPGSGSAARGRR